MKGTAARGVSVWGGQKAPLRRVFLYCFVTVVFAFLILPNFIVIPLSVTDSIYLEFPPSGFTWRWYQDYFGVEGASHFGTAGRWIPATLISLQLALVVVAVAVPMGSLAAYGMTRGRFPGKTVLNAVIISPLIVPILITAIALFFFLSKNLRAFFDPLPAPDLPNTPAVPDIGWLILLIAMAVLIVATLALRFLPNLTGRDPEGGMLRAHEFVLNWFGLLMLVLTPLFLMGLFMLLGEWVFALFLIGVGTASFLGMLLPKFMTVDPDGPLQAVLDRVGPFLPFAFGVIAFFMLMALFTGWTDRFDGNLLTLEDPFPPLPGLSPGLVLAHVMLATPYTVIILSATLRSVDVTLDQASATLGAGPFTTLRRIVLPSMIPGLAGAAFFSFLTSFDELLIALFLSTTEISTLPKEIFDGIRTEISPTIAAIATMLIALTVILLSTALAFSLRLKRKAGILEE